MVTMISGTIFMVLLQLSDVGAVTLGAVGRAEPLFSFWAAYGAMTSMQNILLGILSSSCGGILDRLRHSGSNTAELVQDVPAVVAYM
uniref:Uncharacterized protein n=1 Tax=Leishmania guyanensis TaxID=5670 RepID=A0A1E1IZU9_LEIGU